MKITQIIRIKQIIQFLVVAVSLAAAWDMAADPAVLVQQGRAFLAAKDLPNANARFNQALQEDPNHATANLFYAFTRLFSLAQQPAASNLLTRLGFNVDGRNIYQWTSFPAQDANHNPIAPTDVSAAEMFAFLHNIVLPEVIGAEGNLAAITSSSFVENVSAAETTIGNSVIDYGDVLLLQAELKAFQVFLYSLTSWNTDIQLTSLSNWLKDHTVTLEGLFRQYPNLLQAGSAADLTASSAAFSGAIDTYFLASGFILSRAVGVERLFNLDPGDQTQESKFRQTLTDLRASLSGPVTMHSDTNTTVYMGKFFEKVQAPRPYMPRISGNTWVAGTLPDATFGGFLLSLNAMDLEEKLSEISEPAPWISRIAVRPDRTVELTLKLEVWGYAVVDVSTDLTHWSELDSANIYLEKTNTVTIVDSAAASGGPRFYRAVSSPQSFHLNVYGSSGPIFDATVTAYPGGIIIPLQNGFSGTYGISTRFLPQADFYTISISAPGYKTQEITVYPDEFRAVQMFR